MAGPGFLLFDERDGRSGKGRVSGLLHFSRSELFTEKSRNVFVGTTGSSEEFETGADPSPRAQGCVATLHKDVDAVGE